MAGSGTDRAESDLTVAAETAPLDAPVLTGLASFRVVGNQEDGQKRIIRGRPFRVGFDCSYQRLQEGAPS